MKQVIFPLPTDDSVIEYPKISDINPKHPIGVEDPSEYKYLVVKDPCKNSNSYCYTLLPISRLNDNYGRENNYTSHVLLEELFTEELDCGSQIFLFDSWSEFYEWCLCLT